MGGHPWPPGLRKKFRFAAWRPRLDQFVSVVVTCEARILARRGQEKNVPAARPPPEKFFPEALYRSAAEQFALRSVVWLRVQVLPVAGHPA